MARDPNFEGTERQKPPRRRWSASEPFVDLKLSPLVEIFLTIALIIVAVFQVRIYMRQAKIMRTQSIIMDSTLKQTTIATSASKDQATAAQTQAQVAIDEERRSHRPWVDFVGKPDVTRPLTFDEGSIHVQIGASARNVGNSPALGTSLLVNLMIKPLPDVEMIRKEMRCDSTAATQLGIIGGAVIFPGDNGELRKVRDVIGYSDLQSYPGEKPSYVPWVIICIGYQDEFGSSHGTGMAAMYAPDNPIAILPTTRGEIPGHLVPILSKVAY
jgi:hypothetical protein